MLVYLCPLSKSVLSVTPPPFCLSVQRLPLCSRRPPQQTRVGDPMLGWCWPTVYDAEPTLAQYWVTVSCLAPPWIQASVTEGEPTLLKLWFKASCRYHQHEVLTRAEWTLDSTGPALDKDWVNVSCLLRVLISHIVFRTLAWFKTE